VIWIPNQIFEKSGEGGEISKEKSPLPFSVLLSSETRAATTAFGQQRLMRRFAQFSEDDWLRHLHNGPIDGSQFLDYPSDLVFRDATLSKNSQRNVEIRKLLRVAELVLFMGGDIGRLPC
jgi:hypothetical protein